jgi:hypothetical protein
MSMQNVNEIPADYWSASFPRGVNRGGFKVYLFSRDQRSVRSPKAKGTLRAGVHKSNTIDTNSPVTVFPVYDK